MDDSASVALALVQQQIKGLLVLPDALRDINRQIQTLQGGTLEPVSSIAGYVLNSGFTDPTTPGSITFVGRAQMLLAGKGMRFSRPAHSPFLEIDAPSGMMNADYVVDANGNGTHLTLFGAAGAFAAAVADQASRFIWVCTTVVEAVAAQTSLNGLAGDQVITIASGVHNRATINKAFSGTSLFICSTNSPASASIIFQNIRFGTQFADVFCAGSNGVTLPNFEFDGVEFTKLSGATWAYLFDNVNVNVASNTTNNWMMRKCFGYVSNIVSLSASSNGVGSFYIEGCDLTVDTIEKRFSGTSINWGMAAATVIRNNRFTVTSYLMHINYDHASIQINNNQIFHTGVAICIQTGMAQHGSRVQVNNNSYYGTAVGQMFAQFGSAIGTVANVICVGNSLHGPGSGTAIGVQFVNLGSDPSSVIFTPNTYDNWTTNFDGAFGGGSLDAITSPDSTGVTAHSALSGLTTGNDHTQYTRKDTLTATGDIYYASATSTPAALAIGSVGEILTSSGTLPQWTTLVTAIGHNILSASHLDSTASAVSKGAIIRGNAAGAAWELYAPTVDGYVLTLTAGIPVWAAGGGGGSGGGGMVTMLGDSVGSMWVNMPAALTELLGLTSNRTKVDLTNASTVRLVVNVQTGGVAGAKFRGQYSTDAITWHYLDGATGPECAIDVAGTIASVSVNLEAGAKADVYLRVVGILGDGTVDPVFGAIVLQFNTISGGISVAPPDAPYVTTTAVGGLSAEVVRQWLGNYFNETAPGSPNAMDDEFDDTANMSGTINGLNARWAWRNQSTATATYTKAGYVTISVPASASDNWRIIEQAIPAGDWTVETKYSIEGKGTNYVRAGVVLVDGVNGDLYSCAIDLRTATSLGIETNRWNSVSSYNSTPIALFAWQHFVYMRINYVSGTTTFTFSVSLNGIAWIVVGSFVDAVVATKIGLGVSELNNTGTSKLHCDYFRRTA